VLKCAVQRRQQRPKIEKELAQALQDEWEKLDIGKINGIILSMPDRLAAVERAKGGSIPY